MNTMNKTRLASRLGASLGLLVGMGLLSMNVAVAGIAATKHNLSSAGLATQANSFSGTQAICVFCHTPHGADATASVPLWNRVLPATSTYKLYSDLNTSSLDGKIANVGSVSIACLSCHDGTQAMNVMINQPGSGGYDPAGAPMTGTWTGPASGATPVGSLNYATASIVNIGTDLTNDHPIGIQYGGGGPSGTDTDGPYTGTLGDPDFIKPYKKTINTNPVWWVDTTAGTDFVRDKTDMQLYTRNEYGIDEPFVECASCHNPHTSDNVTFLRIPNTASAVCLACHTK